MPKNQGIGVSERALDNREVYNMSNVLEKIKKELKSGEVIEDIDITSYDENEEVVINKPRNRKMKGSFVKKGALALSLSGPYNSKTTDNIAVVEAAKKIQKSQK